MLRRGLPAHHFPVRLRVEGGCHGLRWVLLLQPCSPAPLPVFLPNEFCTIALSSGRAGGWWGEGGGLPGKATWGSQREGCAGHALPPSCKLWTPWAAAQRRQDARTWEAGGGEARSPPDGRSRGSYVLILKWETAFVPTLGAGPRDGLNQAEATSLVI